MTADLSFSGSGPSRAYTPAARKADGTLSTPTDTTIVELAASGNQARAADIAALQSALLTALGLLATDQDVMAGNAKLEAIRLLLATPALASGAAADTSVQAVTAKAEAIRALLAGTLAITATALPLPSGAAKDLTLSGAFGTTADPATPDITATGASFSFVSLFKGMVSNTLGLLGALGTRADATWDGAAAAPSLMALLKAGVSRLLSRLPVDTVLAAASTSRSLIVPCAASALTISGGGTGYVVNDTITLAGGTNTAPTVLKVTAVASGAVTAATIQTPGSYTVLPANPVAQASTSGAGTGATFAVTWASVATQLAPANATRRGLRIQPQGGTAYVNGIGIAAPDQSSLKIPADAADDPLPHHAGTGAVSIIAAQGAPLPVYAREF